MIRKYQITKGTVQPKMTNTNTNETTTKKITQDVISFFRKMHLPEYLLKQLTAETLNARVNQVVSVYGNVRTLEGDRVKPLYEFKCLANGLWQQTTKLVDA